MGRVFFYIAIAYTLALLLLSLINVKSLPNIKIDNIDKIFHTAAHFGLVVVWYLQYFINSSAKRFRISALLLVCLCAVLFGIFIEVLQGAVTSYRSWSLMDLLANFTGAVIACLVIVSFKNKLEKLKMKI